MADFGETKFEHTPADICVNDLTEEQRQTAINISERIDLTNFDAIAAYGREPARRAADVASKTLDTVLHDHAGRIEDTLVLLVEAVDCLEGGSDCGGYLSGFFGKLNSERTAPAHDLKNDMDTLDLVEKSLERHRLSLRKDIVILDSLYEENMEAYRQLNLYEAAGQLAVDRAANGSVYPEASDRHTEQFEMRLRSPTSALSRSL